MNRIKRWWAERHIRKGLRSNANGWVLTQRGKEYDIEPITREEDTGMYVTEDTDEYIEDNAGMMHTCHGVPFGLRRDDSRPIVDVVAAQVADGAARKLPDGGTINETDQFTIEEISKRLLVGKFRNGRGETIHYLNPFVHVDPDELVDLRNIGKLFLHDSNPDAPRKAAENALEAERALDDGIQWGELGRYAMFIVMLVLGYGFGSQSSGSGISIGLMLMPW
jgi:hypothetical protein